MIRNGGKCYRACKGRQVLEQSKGSLGLQLPVTMPLNKNLHCLWIINAPYSSTDGTSFTITMDGIATQCQRVRESTTVWHWLKWIKEMQVVKKNPKYVKVDLNMCTNVYLLFCLVGYFKSIIAGWKCRCNQNFNFILIISSIAE